MSSQDIFIVRLYSAAKSWNKACKILILADRKDHSARIALNSALALAIELSLKTFLAINGKSEDEMKKLGHNLGGICQALGKNNLDIFAADFQSTYKEKLNKTVDFLNEVTTHSRSFEEWRYLTFITDPEDIQDTYNYEFMANLQRTTALLMEKAHDRYWRKYRKGIV